MQETKLLKPYLCIAHPHLLEVDHPLVVAVAEEEVDKNEVHEAF